jgi:hypothetical protein
MERRFNFKYVLAIPESGALVAASTAASRVTLPERRVVSSESVAVGEDAPAIWPGANIAVIPWASEIRWSNPAATNVTFTRSSYVIERHTDGFRMADLTISGDIDYLPFKDARATAMIQAIASQLGSLPPDLMDVNVQQVLPPAFRAVLAAHKLCERVAKTPGLDLHLYSFDEGRYYLVEPREHSEIRALRNRLGWHYEFRFTALAKVTPPKLAALPAAMPKVAKTNWFTQTIKSLNSAAAGFKDGIRQAQDKIRWAEKQVNDLIDAGDNLVSIIEDAAVFVRDLMNSPMRAYTHMRAVAGRFNLALLTFNQKLPVVARRAAGGSVVGDRIVASLSQDPAATAAARAALRASKAAEDAFWSAMASARLGALQGSSSATKTPILPNDTLESIALRAFGDANKSGLLADLNGLRYPYIARTGGDGVLRPGDYLILPDGATGSTGTFSDPSVDLDERVYGRGVALDSEGDWKRSADGQGVDEVVGLDCVKQGLKVRFQTVQGSNPCAPTMGMPEVVGEETGDATTQAFSVSALWQANRDDRVREVRSLTVIDDGATLGFDAQVRLVTSEDIATGTGG